MTITTNRQRRIADGALAAAAVLFLTAACAGVAHAQIAPGRTRPLAAADQPHLAIPRLRPISDFTDAQGTDSLPLFYPPAPNYAIGMTTATCTVPHCPGRIAVVDYAGGANRYLTSHGYPSLGTQMEGSIVEIPLSDGRAEVTVVLHTKNALTFASTWDASSAAPPDQSAQTNTRLFGNTVNDFIQDPHGHRLAVGESHLVLVFKNIAPGAPMPDLVKWLALGQADPSLAIDSLYFDANATGTLHAAANLGPEGTPGRCVVSQFALFSGPVQGPDFGFFTEIVDLLPTGH